jgi:hypothetical protein
LAVGSRISPLNRGTIVGLFCEGMPCPLCNEPMLQRQPLFGTWGVWLPQNDPLEAYCDAVMHWECYATWEHRSSFARSYFDFWVEGRHQNPHWRPAYFDDTVLVTVNPSPPIEAAWVHLAATGTRHNPKLDDWAAWLQRDDKEDHPMERAAVAMVKRTLSAHVPTKKSLLSQLT